MVALALKIHLRRRCQETRTYDAQGNQLTKTSADGVETRTYNGFGQTMSATVKGVQTIYAYRPDGLRCKKTVGTATTIHIWNGASVIADITNGAISTKYLRGAGLATREAGGKREYYMFNAHGDVVRRMDTAGNAVKEYDYDAFGNENEPDAGDANVFRYCGEYFDKETGNVYLRARYYNPRIGRFGTQDPAMDGLNLYTYCGNNPILLIDPTGNYDRDAAVAYAYKYGMSHNSDYMPMDDLGFNVTYYSNNGTLLGFADCTNFTSQVLAAGGVQMNSEWHYKKTINKPSSGPMSRHYQWQTPEGTPTVRSGDHDFTSSWTMAKSQFEYFSNPNNGYSDETFIINPSSRKHDMMEAAKSGVQPGDLIYWDWDITKEKHSVSHAAVITKIEADGTIKYAAHSNPQTEANLLGAWKDNNHARAYIVKIKDSAT